MIDIKYSIVIYAVIYHVLLFTMAFANRIDITKGRGFLYKKIFDIIVAILQYVFLISWYEFLVFFEKNVGRWITIVTSIFYIYILISIFLYGYKQLSLFKSNLLDVRNNEVFILIISVYVQMFFSIVGLYFCLYLINNSWFYIDSFYSGNIWRIGFEFIYFTFSVTITYSGSGIAVIGVIPKILQMIHVIFFYFFAGDILLTIVKKRNGMI